MIFVYVLIYMDFIPELLFFTQNSVQISAASPCHSCEVCSDIIYSKQRCKYSVNP